MIFNKSRGIRRLLRLKTHEKIFAIAGFGYPSVRFRNKALGKRINIQWNGASEFKGGMDSDSE
jgi:hypothetical protein